MVIMNTAPTENIVEDIEAVVVAIVNEAAGVRSLELARLSDDKMPQWEPGAHVEVILDKDLVRQYSLCGDPDDHTTWRIAVLRETQSRGGSAFVHEQLSVGDRVALRGPRNNFTLNEHTEYLFIAGGIGITPLLPMIARCEAKGVAWQLVYGGRSKESMAFVEYLSRYGSKVTLWPQDQLGLIDLESLLGEPRPDVAVYCCGPGVLLDAVEDRCLSWAPGSLHVERFKPKDTPVGVVDTAFEVELDASGLVLTVGADQTILDVVEAAGVEVPSSCREGTCGTCETVVLEGTPDHRDSFLTAEERTSGEVIMPCCSRSKSARLVLDL